MVLVNLQLKIKSEWDEFIAWFHSVLPDTRTYDGCFRGKCMQPPWRWKRSGGHKSWRAKHTMINILLETEDGTLDTLANYLAKDLSLVLEVNLHI